MRAIQEGIVFRTARWTVPLALTPPILRPKLLQRLIRLHIQNVHNSHVHTRYCASMQTHSFDYVGVHHACVAVTDRAIHTRQKFSH